MAEPKRDGGGDEQVDVAVIQLERDRRKREDEQGPAPTEPDRRAEQEPRPEPPERRPCEEPGRGEEPRGNRGVGKCTELTRHEVVRVIEIHGPVGERVESDGSRHGSDDEEEVAGEDEAGDSKPVSQRSAVAHARMLRSLTVRTPITLFVLALLVRLALIAIYPDAAYPDSYYYVDVARALASGHGLSVDFIWIFAEVGNRIPDVATLPIPSNAHWLPLASLVQVPFIAVLGPTAFASALPLALIGSLAAPLTWAIARDAEAEPIVAVTAGVLSAVPAAATVFMAQPENFAIMHPLVAAAIWLTARGLKGDNRAYAFAGLLAGLASLGRNDGVFLGAAIGLVWFIDRLRWMRGRRGSGSWVHVEDRRPIAFWAAVACLGLFLLVMGPWWVRQLSVFGSISPTSSSGAALWIRKISEWNSLLAHPSLQQFLDQGWAVILASRIAGFWSAVGNFVVVIGSVVLVPFIVIGAFGRARSRDFGPWFLYTAVVFLTATILYPLHVPGGAFIHSAIGLAPHAAILAMEGVLLLVRWIASKRRSWDEQAAGRVMTWGVVGLVVADCGRPRPARARTLGRDPPTEDPVGRRAGPPRRAGHGSAHEHRRRRLQVLDRPTRRGEPRRSARDDREGGPGV